MEDRSMPDGDLVPPQFTESEWEAARKALRLSPQEANIAGMILRDRRDKQIALTLDISFNTVRSHVTDTFERLKLDDRVGLVLRLWEVRDRLRGGDSPPHS